MEPSSFGGSTFFFGFFFLKAGSRYTVRFTFSYSNESSREETTFFSGRSTTNGCSSSSSGMSMSESSLSLNVSLATHKRTADDSQCESVKSSSSLTSLK